MSTINISVRTTETGVVCRFRLDGGYHYIQTRVDPLSEARDINELVEDYIDYLTYWHDYDVHVKSSLKSRGVKNGWLQLVVEADVE